MGAVDRAGVGAREVPDVRLLRADELVETAAAVDRPADRAADVQAEHVGGRAEVEEAPADEVLDAGEARDADRGASVGRVELPARAVDRPVERVAARATG